MLTQSRLKELLHYDPETGVFTWRVNKGGPAKAGGLAGSRNRGGYRIIGIDYRLYQAHRLAWLYIHGEWPKHEIDHINGVRDDNRIDNLRGATHAENHQNRKKSTRNTSGFLGVSWYPATKKWRSRIRTNRKLKSLGLFDTPESAHAAYLSAKAALHTFNPTVRENDDGIV